MAITANTGSNNWNTNGAWVGGVQPTAADDVIIPNSATVTIPTGTTVVCRTLDVQAGATLVFASTTAQVDIGDATGGADALKVSATATITRTGIGTIRFVGAATNGGAGQGITTNGKVMPNMTVQGGSTGRWKLLDALTATSATVSVQQGGLDTNGMAVNAAAFNTSNNQTRVVTFGNSTLTLTSATGFAASTATSLTLNGDTATIVLSGSAAIFNIGGSTAGTGTVTMSSTTIQFTGAGQSVFTTRATTPISYGTITRSGTAAKTDGITFAGATSITIATLNLNANSVVNRLFVPSGTPGVSCTLSVTTLAATGEIDFRDIVGSGTATWTTGASGATYFGDCLGNSGITMTASATQTHTASAGGNWSDATKWTSRVPLPQDDVVVDSNTTGSISLDMPRLGRDINFTGFAGTYTQVGGTNNTSYGSWTFSTGLTISGNQSHTFEGRGSHTLTSAGKSWGGRVFISSVGGTYTQTDAFSTVDVFFVDDGTWATGGFAATCLQLNAVNTGRAKTLTLGASVVSITDTAAAAIYRVNSSGTTCTINAGTSEIVISTASANTRQLVCATSSNAINKLTYTVAASTGILQLGSSTANGAFVIGTLNIGGDHTVNIFAGAVITVTTMPSGTAGHLVTIATTTAGTRSTIALPAGAVTYDYLSVKDIAVTNGPLYARYSTDGGNNGANVIIGQYAALGEATQASAVAAITPKHNVAVSEAIQVSVANITPRRVLAIGQAVQASAIASVAAKHNVTIVEAVELAAAQSVSLAHRLDLGHAPEADIADPTAPRRVVDLVEASETGIAGYVDPSRHVDVGEALECDVADISATRRLYVDQALELDTPPGVQAVRNVDVDQALEADTAPAAAPLRAVTVAQAVTAAIAHPLTWLRRVLLDQAAEVDVAHDLGEHVAHNIRGAVTLTTRAATCTLSTRAATVTLTHQRTATLALTTIGDTR